MFAALRNIRQIVKVANGLPESHKTIIEKSVDRFSKISESILADSKMINQQEIESKVETDVLEAVRSVVSFKQAQYGSTINLIEKINVKTAVSVLNPDQLERSISNLIDNAIEASQAGTNIEIGLTKNGSMLEVLIQDFGKGISGEDLQKIGTKGFSLGKNNGNGLGVFYARRFAEDVGGRIEFASELGKGTSTKLFSHL